jgi:hypothetical protein
MPGPARGFAMLRQSFVMFAARPTIERSEFWGNALTLEYSEMPKYLFSIAGEARNAFPVDLPDRKSVRGEAIRAAGEILRDIDGALKKEWRMVVKDESGEQVLELRFSVTE